MSPMKKATRRCTLQNRSRMSPLAVRFPGWGLNSELPPPLLWDKRSWKGCTKLFLPSRPGMPMWLLSLGKIQAFQPEGKLAQLPLIVGYQSKTQGYLLLTGLPISGLSCPLAMSPEPHNLIPHSINPKQTLSEHRFLPFIQSGEWRCVRLGGKKIINSPWTTKNSTHI